MSSQNPKVDFIFSYVNYALTINCPPSVTVAADKSIESTVPSMLLQRKGYQTQALF